MARLCLIGFIIVIIPIVWLQAFYHPICPAGPFIQYFLSGTKSIYRFLGEIILEAL
jgi:hypothetical protein